MKVNKISAVYQIINTITNDRYVGSSRNVMNRWANHKCPSTWERNPNKQLYLDMKKYGIDKFRFQILAPVMPEYLKQVEQEFIEMLKPTYNNRRAKWGVERRKEYMMRYMKEYKKSSKYKESCKKYLQSEKGRESNRRRARKYMQRYRNQLCSYNGETLTLWALTARFRKAGIKHPTLEARKYLSTNNN